MRAVASPKNIAGADRLARDVAHTEKEIAYYLDRLDIMDEAVARASTISPSIARRSVPRSRPSVAAGIDWFAGRRS